MQRPLARGLTAGSGWGAQSKRWSAPVIVVLTGRVNDWLQIVVGP